MNIKQQYLLTDKDPAPIAITKGQSHILFTGPHNGHAVPRQFSPCMGTDPNWFATAHEAVDLYIAPLFDLLRHDMPDANFIEGIYSRLVCDLNAMPDYAITLFSPEKRDLTIPENQPDMCCAQKRLKRLDEIYWPYHEGKEKLINTIRAAHNDKIIALDLHSFTPTWEQKKRDVEIGTIRAEKTPFSRALEDYLKQQDRYHFVSGEPYKVANRPSNAAPSISEKNDLQYLGLEIRSDLIDNDDKRKEMANFIQNCLDHLMSHSDLSEITKRRSATQLSSAPLQMNDFNWSI
tara:strand:- start:645 stop:1517 length:873 start_codon:yes stop_codon:yes gene_type:complete